MVWSWWSPWIPYQTPLVQHEGIPRRFPAHRSTDSIDHTSHLTPHTSQSRQASRTPPRAHPEIQFFSSASLTRRNVFKFTLSETYPPPRLEFKICGVAGCHSRNLQLVNSLTIATFGKLSPRTRHLCIPVSPLYHFLPLFFSPPASPQPSPQLLTNAHHARIPCDHLDSSMSMPALLA